MLKPVNAEGTQAIEGGAVAGSSAKTHSVRWVLVALALSMLLSSLGISSPNVALPTIALAFNASFPEVQWIVVSYLLAITIMIVGVGRLGDIMGHRRVLLAGIAVFTLASVLCGVAPTLWALIAARVVQGIGAAILMALTLAMVRETVPKERTGSAMGLLGTMSAIGTALGPSLGGVLVAGPGWQSIFLAMVPLGILNFVFARRFLPEGKPKAATNGNRFDKLGTLLLGVTLAAYALAVTIGGGHFARINQILLIAAVVGAGLFLFVQARVASPLIKLAAFRNVVLSSSLAMNVLVATVMMTTLVVGPFFLSRALGLSNAMVGAVMAVGPIISTLTGIPAGRIVDRLGATAIIFIGLLALAIGAFAIALLPSMIGVAGYIVGIFILTPGYQLFQASNNTAVMIDVNPDQRGVISGMLSLSRNLGLITGASVMGAVFAFASKTTDITTAHPEAIAIGMRTTFSVSAVLLVIALLIALASRGALADAEARAGKK
ncbi:MFS transporter [Paraburkholderia megapolitana]|nr:MFS transporter [Paraburkholderia megapolitana]QDQ80289.1 MFS transporter [Paraburkholderia megapolitana]